MCGGYAEPIEESLTPCPTPHTPKCAPPPLTHTLIPQDNKSEATQDWTNDRPLSPLSPQGPPPERGALESRSPGRRKREERRESRGWEGGVWHSGRRLSPRVWRERRRFRGAITGPDLCTRARGAYRGAETQSARHFYPLALPLQTRDQSSSSSDTPFLLLPLSRGGPLVV